MLDHLWRYVELEYLLVQLLLKQNEIQLPCFCSVRDIDFHETFRCVAKSTILSVVASLAVTQS